MPITRIPPAQVDAPYACGFAVSSISKGKVCYPRFCTYVRRHMHAKVTGWGIETPSWRPHHTLRGVYHAHRGSITAQYGHTDPDFRTIQRESDTAECRQAHC